MVMTCQRNYTALCECFNNNSVYIYTKCPGGTDTITYQLCLSLVAMVVTMMMIFIFTRQHMLKSSMNFLLAALEISNFISLLTWLPSAVFRLSCPRVQAGTGHSVAIEVLLNLYFPSIYFTNWITPIIGVWRFVAVTWPFKAKIYLTKKTSFILMAVASLISICFSIYIFLYRSAERSNQSYYSHQEEKCMILPTYQNIPYEFESFEGAFLNRCLFLTLWFFVSLTPCVMSVGINIGLICVCFINRKRNNGEQESAISSRKEMRFTIILVVFLLCHVISYISPELVTLLVFISPQRSFLQEEYFCFLFYHFPGVIYLSFLSFVCYLLMSVNFRKTAYDTFKIGYCLEYFRKRRRDGCCKSRNQRTSNPVYPIL